jgi:hypothetical protein
MMETVQLPCAMTPSNRGQATLASPKGETCIARRKAAGEKIHRSFDAATGAPEASASVRPPEFSGE